MLEILKTIALVIFTALTARATSLILQFSFFVDQDVGFWKLLTSCPFWHVFPNIIQLNQNITSVLIVAPILEGVILTCTIFLTLKLKLPKIIIIIFITIFAYFVHKTVAEGFYAYQASIAYCAIAILYFHVLRKSRNSHICAYCVTAITHAVYNFSALYLITVYEMSGLLA